MRPVTPKIRCKVCKESVPSYLYDSHARQHTDAEYAQRMGQS